MRRFALVGHPVTGSLSPAMHNAAFAAAGLDARYEARDVAREDLAEVFGEAAGYSGLNVTVPHKTAAVALCDTLSESARLAGAVNTVVFAGPGRRVAGHNTDVLALLAVMREWLRRRKTTFTGRGPGGAGFRAAVLGAGGAARAAAVASALAGAAEVVLAARAVDRAVGAADDLGRRFAEAPPATAAPAPARFRGMELARLAPDVFAAGFEVVVQATSAPDGALGPFRRAKGPGGSARSVCPAGLAIELNYRPPWTGFLEEAEAARAWAVDGLEILLRQGEEAFRLFTGTAPPPGVMHRALLVAASAGPTAAGSGPPGAAGSGPPGAAGSGSPGAAGPASVKGGRG